MIQIAGKVALVTGGGGIIGRSACQMLAQAGAKVVVAGRTLSSIEETVKTIVDTGGEAIAVKLDVSCENSWQQAIDTTLKSYKKLNILVNNAGIWQNDGPSEDVSLSNWKHLLSVNLDGTFLGVRSAIGVMKDNKESNSIINIASISGQMPDMRASYSVSKAGVLMLGKCAALECRKKGYDNIRVNTILPGGVLGEADPEPKSTEEFDRYYPPVKFGRPKDIAGGVLFLASEYSSYMSGGELVIDDGYSASVGGFLTVNMVEQLEKANATEAEESNLN